MKVLPLGRRWAASGPSILLLPDDLVLGVALGDAVAVVLGHEDVVAGQQLGVERKFELIDLQARSDWRRRVRGRGPGRAGRRGCSRRCGPLPPAWRRPPWRRCRPTTLSRRRGTCGGRPGPRRRRRRGLVVGDAVEQFLDAAGLQRRQFVQQGDQHRHGLLLARRRQGQGRPVADERVGVLQEFPHGRRAGRRRRPGTGRTPRPRA